MVEVCFGCLRFAIGSLRFVFFAKGLVRFLFIRSFFPGLEFLLQ